MKFLPIYVFLFFLILSCDSNPTSSSKKIERKLITSEVIFFSSDRDGAATNIYMMDVDGELIKKITDFETGEYVATAISPDSNQLLFYEAWPGLDIDIGYLTYLYNIKKDSIIGPITFGHPGNFTPDGKKFIFSRYNDNTNFEYQYETILLYDLENDTETQISQDGKTSFYPQISPNGEMICYESAKFLERDSTYCWQLHLMDMDGNFITDLTENVNAYYAGKGVFTPDNRSVVFFYNEQTWCYDICMINIHSKEIKYITRNRFEGRYDITSDYFNPNVNFDGSKIYFFSRYYIREYPHPTDIYVINIDGSGKRNLTNFESSDSHPVSGIVAYYVEE